MVVVCMRPTGRIDLACGNAYGTKGRNRKRTFLSATANGRTHGGKRGAGTAVRGLVGDMFVTPMVHLEHGIVHAHVSYPVLQLVIEDGAGIVQVLVIYPDGQDKMFPFPFGDGLSPRHFLACLQRGLYTTCPIGAVIVHTVRQRHVAVKEIQRLLFGRRSSAARNKKQNDERQTPKSVAHSHIHYIYILYRGNIYFKASRFCSLSNCFPAAVYI